MRRNWNALRRFNGLWGNLENKILRLVIDLIGRIIQSKTPLFILKTKIKIVALQSGLMFEFQAIL
jgi:hypothetical protein